MKKNILILFFCLVMIPYQVFADNYPEFDGHYIMNNGEWQKLQYYEYDNMFYRDGTNPIFDGHLGFLGLPDPPCIKITSKRPRFCVVTSNNQYNVGYEALIKLTQLPFNTRRVDSFNNKEYNGNITYSGGNFKKKMWVSEKELRLKTKTVQGRIGTYIFEPEVDLAEGLYVLDFGKPAGNTHEANITQNVLARAKRTPLTGAPFIIGQVEDFSSKGGEGQANSTQKPGNSSQDPVGEAISGLFDSIFKTK